MRTVTVDSSLLLHLRLRLYAYARRALQHDGDAEDVTQEALLAVVLSCAPRFRGEASLSTYATAILKHKIADLMRARGAQRRAHALFASEALCHADMSPDPCTTLWRRRQRERFWPHLRKQLRALPPQTRDVFVLRLLDECDVDETSRRLRISRNHTAVLTSRAKKKLRYSLDRAMLTE